jgi:hypothetical protein
MPDHPATHPARRAAIAAAAATATGALILGGIAVASAQPGDPSVTDTTVESTTTTAASSDATDTTDTTVDDTTETTVDATETTLDDTTTTDVEGDEGDEAEGDDDAAHPENHGKDVSEAARDHSHDEEAGNHGAYVRGVARGDSATSTTAPTGEETSTSGHGRRGR